MTLSWTVGIVVYDQQVTKVRLFMAMVLMLGYTQHGFDIDICPD